MRSVKFSAHSDQRVITQIMLTCRLVQADSMESQTWIDDNVKLHSSSSGAQWALLTAKKAAALTERFTQPGQITAERLRKEL